jgi:hypothetical protein
MKHRNVVACLLVAYLMGALTVGPLFWVAAKRQEGRRGARSARFLDDMSDTNVRFARELDIELKGLDGPDRESAYRAWRARYDESVRAVYVRHNKPLPPHLLD